MLDARVRRFRDDGLGVIGDTQASRLEHRNVVCAVARRERVMRREAEAVAQLHEGRDLRIAPQDRLFDAAGQFSIFDDQPVAALLVEPDHRGDSACEQGKAARDEAGVCAVRPHGGEERARTGCQRDAPLDDLIDNRGGKTLQQRHTLAQCGLERDLAAHRALRNRRHVRFQADIVRELVDALLANHGGIHVGDEQLLASPGERLNHKVNRQVSERGVQPFGDDFVVRTTRRKQKIGGNAGIEDAHVLRGREHADRKRDCRLVESEVRWTGDESGDVSHRGSEEAVLIAGPTASGKSALALAVAQEIGGTIINADSMQVYRDLRVITARPTADEEGRLPHRLYGHIDAAENYSVGRWLSDVRPVLDEVRAAGRRPILVGGTGLYFKALTQGLASVPPIPDDIRANVRARMQAEGPAVLHAELLRRDPSTQLKPNDRTRIARALEVLETTGRPLSEWHREGLPPLLDAASAVKVFLAPERPELRRRIDARFDTMLAAGALNEVRALAARKLDPLLPAMKAHGVPWMIRHLAGEVTLAEAAEGAKSDTRRYTKRQFTWARHQLPDWTWVEPETALPKLLRMLGY